MRGRLKVLPHVAVTDEPCAADNHGECVLFLKSKPNSLNS